MKVLLFEDEREHGDVVTKHLLGKVPGIEVLWFGGIEKHKQPPMPHPFSGTGDCVLRAKCQVVTKSATVERDINLFPGELSGAILDIYVDRIKVGENIARWLQYAEFSGPVLLYTGHDLPPVFPALPMILACQKEPHENLIRQLDAFCDMLSPDGARVNSRGVSPGGADRLPALRWKKPIVWDWFPATADMGPFSSVLGPGQYISRESFATNPLLARDSDAARLSVAQLSGVRVRSRNSYPFYLILERERDGVAPMEALKAGVVYLDQKKLLNEPLRFAVETAEECLYRYTALVKKYPLKNLDRIDRKDGPLLASFLIAYLRAVAFAGGSRALYTTTSRNGESRIGWIEQLAGARQPQTFEKGKTSLLQSARSLSLIPKSFQVP